MRMTRRAMLASAGAAALMVGGAGLYAAAPSGVRDYTLRVVSRVFGSDVAAQPAAQEFAEAYEAFVLEKGAAGRAVNAVTRLRLDGMSLLKAHLDQIEDSIVEKFATSTNVVLAHETGEPLNFAGIFQPYHSPCLNQLGGAAVSA